MTRLHRAISLVENVAFTALWLIFAALGCLSIGCIIWLVLHGLGAV